MWKKGKCIDVNVIVYGKGKTNNYRAFARNIKYKYRFLNHYGKKV